MNLAYLRSQAFLNEASDDNKKNQKKNEDENAETVNNSEGNTDDTTKDNNDNKTDDNGTDDTGEQPEDNEPPTTDTEEGSTDDNENNFSLDDDTIDNDPVPDGLPEADDDGSTETSEDSAETNVHTNILNLSKLDRTIAKRVIYQHFIDLRSTISSTKTMIERNETVIEPEIRERTNTALNKISRQLDDFLKYKFQIINYEDALMAYMIFIKEIDSCINGIKNDGINKTKSKQ